MRSVDSFNFNGKKALIRVDFNVPIDKNIVTDSSRILAAKNTIDKVCNDGGSCILMSHLGRPNGFQLEYSLSKIVKTVESVLNKVPVVTHQNNVCHYVSGRLEDINERRMPAREDMTMWLRSVANNQFTLQEIEDGIAYDMLKDQYEN